VDGGVSMVAQAIVLRGLTLRDWGTGYYARRADQSTLENCVIAYVATGINVDTSCNSLVMINTGIAQATVEGAYIASAEGGVIIGGDCGNQPRSFRFGAGGGMTMIGGNFESVTGAGTEMILLDAGARLSITGARFLIGTENDVPLVRCTDTAYLWIDRCNTNGTDLVDCGSAGAVIAGTSSTAAVSAPYQYKTSSDDKIAMIPFPSIPDNSGLISTASAATRGQIYRIYGRDGLSQNDGLVFHYRNSAGSFITDRLDGRAAKGGNTDLTTITGLNLGSVSNPPLRSASGGTTTGVYFSTNTVGLTSSGAATFVAAAGAASIPVASVTMANLPVYEDNARAVTGGLATGRIYRTATGEMRVVIP
jgi:hypothetical protein